ncbi:hypothetical protein PTSG_05191 [Salpingoeca rosetta]|uniref:Uncharacterized protein n=1 Tax=Salpingoeca rosetta (strain ATCC 50818 / BSB-021) TaxID=946362 RepID=F2UAS1_SALR5|nr:uncharacterized protein PTSG_05191 [Salpingoeca rosetta]EGD73487.1 hypothetical protein PTSG_05191 [Salpingoeca rosetta]|eukprot:XP_004993769.1 hypothetical protein PTSG_05191 [Salpingoeca rosetta]
MKEFKVCLLGSGSVGKSALAIQFTEDRFVQSYDPTVEDCYRKQVTFNDEPVMLEIIDTAGTEQFTSMVEIYIKNCQGFILVYDVTKKSTFDDLEAIKDKVWQTKKATKKRPPPMLVVGNKVDVDGREVLFATGHGRAKEWKATFLETSAKTRTNVEDAFQGMVQKLAQGNKGGCTLL